MQTKSELTPAQAKTLAFIRSYIRKHGYSPTISEMAEDANVNGNAINDRLAVMLKKGAITKTPGIARSIRPVTPA